MSDNSNIPTPAFVNPIKNANFQTAEELRKKENGKQIAQAIWQQQAGQKDNLYFFSGRAARFLYLESWATGTQDMNQFRDFMNISNSSADKAYTPMDMTPDMLGPQFMGTLVESMCKNEEYPCVYAVDADSLNEKAERQMDAIFRMKDADNINQLQELGGMQLEPVNAYVPDNELAAKIYFELEDRLPKEIRFEKLLEKCLIDNKYQKVLKRENIYDMVLYNMGVVKIEKCDHGYNLRRCIKRNVFYNFFQNDSGENELSYIGEVYKLKVRELRTKYGKSPERPDGLTEEQIYNMAKSASQFNAGLIWNPDWQYQYQFAESRCPWDDFSVLVIDGEIKVSEPKYYVSKIDNFGKENITPKKSKPEVKSDKAEVVQTNNERWYRFVYAPDSESLVYWGPGDIVLTDYKNTKRSYSSYTVVIPMNNGRYIPSLFERIIGPLKRYQIASLKQTQLIAKLRPSGVRIDVATARNLDIGEGNVLDWLEVVRFFDQTGNELYSSEGLDPNQKEAPVFSPTTRDESVQKIVELTNIKNSILAEIRGLIGVPQYRDGADVGDRTAAKLAEMQSGSSFNVTDFISTANHQLMEEVLKKICILEWQKVVKTEPESREDLINTVFDVYVRMRLTEYERSLLEANIEKWSSTLDASGQPIISPKDAFRIRQIDNFKLAEMYLANVVEEHKKLAQEQAAAAQQAAAQERQAAEQAAIQQRQSLLEMETQSKIAVTEAENKKQKESGMLTFITSLILENQKTGAPIPPMLMPVIQQMIENVMIPVVADTEETQKMLVEKTRQEQMAAKQQQQMEEQGITPEQQQQMEMQQQMETEPQM